MVFALETFWPASDGWSAARIEEELVVTATGCEVITRFPAEELLVAGTRYYAVSGPLAAIRETQSHLNGTQRRGAAAAGRSRGRRPADVATDVIMPALGVAQDTGRVVRWLYAEGDAVRKGQPLIEVETDKVTVELEAPGRRHARRRHRARRRRRHRSGRVIALILAPGEAPPHRRAAAARRGRPAACVSARAADGARGGRRPGSAREPTSAGPVQAADARVSSDGASPRPPRRLARGRRPGRSRPSAAPGGRWPSGRWRAGRRRRTSLSSGRSTRAGC